MYCLSQDGQAPLISPVQDKDPEKKRKRKKESSEENTSAATSCAALRREEREKRRRASEKDEREYDEVDAKVEATGAGGKENEEESWSREEARP